MSTPHHEQRAQLEKTSVAGVSFTCKKTGKLDESAIDKEETNLSDHYLYGSGSNKSDYSYPVVGADGCLYLGNVKSAWSLGCRGQCSDADAHDQRLKKLSAQFDSDPLADKSRAGKQAFEKHVEIAKADTDRNVVIGVAMEPGVVDSQGDFERAATIESLSEGFMERLAVGDAGSGVMHVSFPSQNVLSHVENRVLTQSETIGDTEYPAGTWQIGVKVRDETLQRLIDSGTLSGFSIGGYVHDTTHHAADELPDDVRIDDDIQETATETDEPIREITDATIHEISLVDMPAVQRAQIQTAKGEGLAKGAPALTESVETATAYLTERGHDKDDARELAEFLNREKSATPPDADASWLQRAKRFFTDATPHSERTDDATDTERAEKGQVLSEENLARGMAIHDVALDLLGTEIDHGREKFATDSSYDFAGVAFVQPEDAGGEGTILNATGLDSVSKDVIAQQPAEPAESGRDADPADDSDPLENMTEEETNEVLERLDALESKFEDDDDPDDEQPAEKEKDTEADDDPTETTERMDALESTVEDQTETQQRMVELLEQMAAAQGVSQQADPSATTGEEKAVDWSESAFAKQGGD